MKYRRDIDGLRCVAVLSVVAFHYFPPILHGGFIGVDIFFVISGYLISGNIFTEIDAGTFSIAQFYRRRINRIFPALGCVLIASLIIGWFTLFPDELKSLGLNTIASASFVENLYLWTQNGYFDSDSSKKPLLHLWSLGIEEQFYIVYPPMLVLAHKGRLLGLRFLLVCCIASFCASLYTLALSQSADFYLPITRFWELSVGGILAWQEQKISGAQARPSWLTEVVSGTGMLGILAGFLTTDARTPFPGAAALLPVLGAALVISAGPLARPNNVIFSNRLAVFIGKISYPLYLWHWPLLAFLYIVNIEKPEPPIRVVLIGIAVALATATWLVIETPIRRQFNSARTSMLLLASMAMVISASYVIADHGGFEARLINRINAGAVVRASGLDSPPLPIHDCEPPPTVASLFRNCIQEQHRSAQFVLLGDSKADALYRGLMKSSLPGGRWLYLGGADATTFGAPEPLLSSNPAWSGVQAQSRAAIDYVSHRPDIRLVLYAVALRNIYVLDANAGAGRVFKAYDHRFLKNLYGNRLVVSARAAVIESVGQLVAAGKTVAILVDNPPMPPLRSCNGRLTASGTLNTLLGLKHGSLDPDCFYPKSKYRNEAKAYFEMLRDVKVQFGKRVILLDYTDFYCQEQRGTACGTSIKGNALYGYTDHISSYTASVVGQSINEQLREFDDHPRPNGLERR